MQFMRTNNIDRAWWDGNPSAHPARPYRGMRRFSQYVPVRDGTRIAVDVYLPKDLPAGHKLPAILTVTPYFRGMEMRWPLLETLLGKYVLTGTAEYAPELVSLGFARVAMDMRGCGASYGWKVTTGLLGMQQDAPDVLDWIVAQPWSNGRVGAIGISGPGLTSTLLAATKHPALGAIAPRFTTFDIYGSTRPGGLRANSFVQDVGRLVDAMDTNQLHRFARTPIAQLFMRLLVKGIRPVDGPDGHRQLAEAVHEHRNNQHFDRDLQKVVYRDDPLESADPPATLDSVSPHTQRDDLAAAGVPFYAWTAWHDGGFLRDLLSMYNTVATPGRRLVIGAWNHGGRRYSDPSVIKKNTERVLPGFDHAAEMARFFHHHLNRPDPAFDAEAPIHYFTMIEQSWKSAPSWPPPGTRNEDRYLGAGTLAEAPPVTPESIRYRVDFTAGTGISSRFGRHLAGGRLPVCYPDRASRDHKLLCFTGTPEPQDLEITGSPLVTLRVSCTAPDAALFVYLEDVSPDGEVLVITDGGLRLAFATATSDDVPYWLPGPYRPLNRSDEHPLQPQGVIDFTFDLHPISWLVRAGHRLRVAIAGADEDTFVPVARDQSPIITVHTGGLDPARVQLPVMPRA